MKKDPTMSLELGTNSNRITKKYFHNTRQKTHNQEERKMSLFTHRAQLLDTYNPQYGNQYNEIQVPKDEVVLLLEEHTANGWSRIQRINDTSNATGIVPTSFLQFVKVLDVYDNNGTQTTTTTTTTVEPYQYEGYYRNYGYKCSSCKQSILAPKERYHCLDCGESYDSFNLCVHCFENANIEFWKSEAKKRIPVQLIDEPIFTKVKHHPAMQLWLVTGNTIAETLNNTFLYYADRPCLAYRKQIGYDVQNNLPIVEPKFTWSTFAEIHNRSLALGSGLQQIVTTINRLSGKPDNQRGFVGICSINRIEWFITDFALQLKGMVTIPLPKNKFDNEDLIDMAHVMNNGDVTVVVCSREYTAQCLTLVSNSSNIETYVPTLKALVQMDTLDPTNETDVRNAARARELNIKLFSMSDVEALGMKQPDWETYVQHMPDNELVTIVYTSGSTGKSKGAIITKKNFMNQITKPYYAFHPLVSLSFCPLSHTSDRMNVWNTLINGGRSGMYSGDMGLIFDDFQALQPTVLSSTPRLYNSIYAEYQKAKVVMRTSGTEVNEEQLMQQFSSILGGRMRAMTTGGAATSQEVIDFLRSCFKCKVYNGYASTEVGAISWIDVGKSQGTPDKMLFDGVEVKLVEVPDLGYLLTDKPNPRGEICVKSPHAIPGYYKDEEKTRELIDPDGWYHTGDIGAIDHLGNITVIDRLKNIFKLAQGEFVAPEPLENNFLSSEFIDQIFIYGDSMKSFLVAIIVPNIGVVEKYAREYGMQFDSISDLCQRGTALYKAIMSDVHRIGKTAKVAGYEIPKGFLFELEKFTVENGKLTGPNKTCRPYLTKVYKKELDALYEELDVMTHADDLVSSISNALGLDNGGLNSNGDLSMAEVGGDSISAARISAILEKKLNIKLSVKDLLQNVSLSDLAEMIKTGKTISTTEKPINLFEETALDLSIHPNPLILNTVKPPTIIENVLLTGATGFLGGALLEELLLQTHVSTCKIHCIVRAESDRNAYERILNNLKSMNSKLTDDHLMRIVAYKGDLSQPQLGLSEDTWNTLCTTIDTVYHNGAHVNFLLSYRELYDSNVRSGIELLKLCVAGDRLKPLHFVSTIGVLGAPNRTICENEPLDTAVPEQVFHQLGGYSQSKYVAEKLMNEAVQRHIPVSIFRPELIVGHSVTGHSNSVEWISRFICGIIQMGVAPYSDSRVHMVTVDFVAKAIVALTNSSNEKLSQTLRDYKQFHVVNTNNGEEASISVNEMVRGIQSYYGNTLSIKQLEYNEWREYVQRELTNNPTSKNPLFPILSMFGPTGFPSDIRLSSFIDHTHLSQGLTNTGVTCPAVNNEQLMHRFLDSFVLQKQVQPRM
jgi:fatty acid CoA ligase FadD9